MPGPALSPACRSRRATSRAPSPRPRPTRSCTSRPTRWDIGFQIQRHCPWIPKENVRYSYAWIRGAAGPASKIQVKKFTDSIYKELKKAGVEKRPMGTDLIDQNMMIAFKEANINWTDGVTPMLRARAVKNQDEHECLRICASICDATHYEISKILRPGVREKGR